jgi:hypothetical protein
MSMRTGVALMIALSAAACAPVILKTPVGGTRADISQLVGEWQGDYESIDSGRRGSIAFRLRAGADTAEGDVLMEPRNALDPSAPDAAMPHEAFGSGRQTLAIRFVVVDANRVTGVLEPYKDPGCGCTLTTTFIGTLRGNAIEGTFRSEGSELGHIPQAGRWRVKRLTR